MTLRSQRIDSSLRLRAGILLALFALALTVGVLGHPYAGDSRVCHAGHDHLESAPDHPHDSAGCASCHLFRTLSQSRAPSNGDGLCAAATAVVQAAVAVERLPSREALFSFASRAPPLA